MRSKHVTEVFIRKNPFITMVASAVEVYPKECLGVLFGHRTQNTAIVEQAFCYQTAERTEYSVEVKDKEKESCCKLLLEKLTSLELLGEFHSHPKGTTRLTSCDKRPDSMSIGNIEVVIAFSVKKEAVNWKYNRKELSGTLGDFGLNIAAYTCYRYRGKTKHEKISVSCPFALDAYLSKIRHMCS